MSDKGNLFGKVDIMSGRIFDHPRFDLGDRVGLGYDVRFLVSKEIVLEEGCERRARRSVHGHGCASS